MEPDKLRCPYCTDEAMPLPLTVDILAELSCASCGMTFSRALAVAAPIMARQVREPSGFRPRLFFARL